MILHTCLKVKFGKHFENADSSVSVGISPLASLLATKLNFVPVDPRLNDGPSGSALPPIDLVIPANILIF